MHATALLLPLLAVLAQAAPAARSAALDKDYSKMPGAGKGIRAALELVAAEHGTAAAALSAHASSTKSSSSHHATPTTTSHSVHVAEATHVSTTTKHSSVHISTTMHTSHTTAKPSQTTTKASHTSSAKSATKTLDTNYNDMPGAGQGIAAALSSLAAKHSGHGGHLTATATSAKASATSF